MDREQQLDEVITAYLKSAEAGERPDAEEWLARHPDLADELREFLSDQYRLERVAAPLREMALAPQPPHDGQAPTLGSGDTLKISPTLGTVRYFGDYEMLEEVARGGMGVVYRARQVSLNRVVALKMILSGQLASRADVQRFRQEAEAAANLDHPNIVPIHEVGEHEGQHYFSMKFMDGQSLSQRIDRYRGDPRAAARLLEMIARAVHHAHQRGILHRDLKPGNVLFDSAGEAHLTDFGLATRLEGHSGMTQTGAIVGTPSYMAPEQARAEKGLTVAVDVYALGAILYECLTGRPPFRAATPLETVLQVVSEEPVPLRQLNPRAPVDLETIAHKCLQKDPARRCANAQDLADDLGRYLRGEPIVARSVGTFERAVKWVRRNAVVSALAAVVLLALTVGAAVSTYFAFTATREAAAAREAETITRHALTEADTLREAAQRQVVKLDVATSAQLADRGDHDQALHWVARAWLDDLARLRPGQELTAAETADHRLRAGAALEQMPLLVGFCPHDRPVLDADCDPAGERVVTLVGDNLARVWDAPRSELVYPPLGHDGWVTSALFSPDGRHLATGSLDGTARVWDAATGQLLHTFRAGAPVASVAFSPDGQTLAAAAGSSVRRWGIASGKEESPIEVGGRLAYVAFSPDGGRLVTVGETEPTQANTPANPKPSTQVARVWDAATGEPLSEPLPHPHYNLDVLIRGHRRWEEARGESLLAPGDVSPNYRRTRWPAFSPDGKSLCSADAQHYYLWREGDRGVTAIPFADGGPDQPWIAFGADARFFYSVRPSIVYLGAVTLPTGRRILSVPTGRQPRGLAVSPDGKWAAVPVSMGNVHLYDLPSGVQSRLPLRHQYTVSAIRFTPDGRRLLVATFDGMVRVWQVPGAVAPEAYARDCGRADRLQDAQRCFSPDGHWEAVHVPDRAEVLVCRTGQPSVTLPRTFPAFVARFSPDSRHLVTWNQSEDHSKLVIEVWRLGDGPPSLVAATPSPDGAVATLAFSADGKRLAAGICTPTFKSPHWDRNQLRVWEFPSLRHIGQPILPRPPRLFGQLVLNRDGSLLASCASTDGRFVPCWETATGRQSPVGDLSPGLIDAIDIGEVDGRLLVRLTDSTLRQINPRTGRRVGPTIPHGSTNGKSAAAYSPDQRWIALVVISRTATGIERKIHVYRADSGDLLALHPLAPAPLNYDPDIWFSADGKRVIAHTLRTGRTESWRLPEYLGPVDQLPTLARLLTGLAPNPDGGFLPLGPDEMVKHREEYRRAFRAFKGIPP